LQTNILPIVQCAERQVFGANCQYRLFRSRGNPMFSWASSADSWSPDSQQVDMDAYWI